MQQNAVVVFSEAAVQNIQESEKRKSIPAAINHLLVSATKRKSKTLRNRFANKKGNDAKAAERLTADESYHKAKPEVKQNAYEKESMQHLNELFKGDQKEHKETKTVVTEKEQPKQSGKQVETKRTDVVASASKMANDEKCRQREDKHRDVEPTLVKKDKRVASNSHKIQHVGLNGEVSSLETEKSTQNRPVFSALKSARKPPKLTVVESSSLTVTATNCDTPKPVNVPDKSSTVAVDTGASSFSGTGRVYSRGTSNSTANSAWLLEEDKRCKYPENFKPFPQRNKQPSRSRILYGNMSEKGAKRIDAFQGKKEMRQGFNGVAINGAPDGKRS